MVYVEGLRRLLPDERSRGLVWLVKNHPAFVRPDPVLPPDLGRAELHFANGLRHYFDRRYSESETDLLEAVRYNDQDARYQYFLGLARLPQQGKRDLALEDFRLAARLEIQNRPSRAAVSVALERIQGPPRRVLDEVRQKAYRDALGP
jgi:tetratricopeptide (TPR) repeat protein